MGAREPDRLHGGADESQREPGEEQRMTPHRMHRRAAWMTESSRPSCSSSWARVPWRRSRDEAPARERSSATNAADTSQPAVNLTATSSAEVPEIDMGTRTWAELVGLMDPMAEQENLLAPVVLENAIERIAEGPA